MIQESRYVIAVPNLKASAEYYQNVLGFDVKEIGDGGWRMFVKDQCCIMAGECPDAKPASELGDLRILLTLSLKPLMSTMRI